MPCHFTVNVSASVPTGRIRVCRAWARFCAWSLSALVAWAESGIKVRA